MDLMGLCSICGRSGLMHTCSLCGRLVCNSCFDGNHNICINCKINK